MFLLYCYNCQIVLKLTFDHLIVVHHGYTYSSYYCLNLYLMSATLAQWGERSLSERTAQVRFPVRPDKTYTVFCGQECPYKMNPFVIILSIYVIK